MTNENRCSIMITTNKKGRHIVETDVIKEKNQDIDVPYFIFELTLEERKQLLELWKEKMKK